MPRRHVIISVHNGVHARPVAELARRAIAHSAPVTLTTREGTLVDLSSVLAVMDLGLVAGDEVTLQTESSIGAEELMDALCAVLDPPR